MGQMTGQVILSRSWASADSADMPHLVRFGRPQPLPGRTGNNTHSYYTKKCTRSVGRELPPNSKIMKNIKLQNYIGIGFATIWLGISVVILLAVYRTEKISDQLGNIASQHNIKIALAVNMRDILYQRQLLMRNALMFGDAFDREADREKLSELAQQFILTRDKLQKMNLNTEEQWIFERLRDELQEPVVQGRTLVDSMVFEGLNNRTLHMMRDVSAGQQRVIGVLNELVAYETSLIDGAVTETRQAQIRSRNMLILLGGIVAALNFIVAYLVIRHSRRLTEQIELLARFPSENPRPVMRIGFDGELIYANSASQPFLNEWETEVGHLIPLKWQRLVQKIASDQGVLEEETTIDSKIYSLVMTPVIEGEYINVYGHDITEREQIRKEFARLASHDALTGLINRREFELVLESLITDAKTNMGEHSFLYFDLDQFKVVNDTCGHVAGDEMLRQLALVLKENVRESDKLGRLGGDEFGLLLRSCSLDRAEKVAETMRELIQNFRFVWKNQSFNVGASIGVVLISEDTSNLSVALSAADAACYIAKESGRNRVHVSYPGDEQLQVRRGQMEWVQRIRDAIGNDEFELYYQEIYSLKHPQAESEHGELLLRLFDVNGKQVPPETFIKAAERYDLMTSIDRWVVKKALPILSARMRTNASGDGWYSINLSGQSISEKNFTSFVIDQISSSGVPASSLCFEITETAAISNLTSAIDFISNMREKGCKIALDDFGSGLSSFNYLKNLKIDYLKIDGSFVRNMHEDRVSAAMVEAITNVAHEMNIGVIAEWVEKQATIKMLQKLNVEFGQGYAYSEPMPLDQRGLSKVVN